MGKVIAFLFCAGLALAQYTPPSVVPGLPASAPTGAWQTPQSSAAGVSGWIAGCVFTVSTSVFSCPGSVAVGNNVLNPVQGVNDPIAPLLPHWRHALANQRTGVSDAKILFIGDSRVSGTGDSIGLSGSFPWQVCNIAKAAGLFSVCAPGLAMPINQVGTGVPVTGFAVGADWISYGSGFAGSTLKTYTYASNFVFTPATWWPTTSTQPVTSVPTYDSFDVYWLGGPGYGTLTCTATGGTPVVINTNTTSIPHMTTVKAGSAATSNVLTCVPSIAFVAIIGVEPWLSTVTTIRFGLAGQSGTTSVMWNNSAISGITGGPSIQAYAPDLTVILLDINDASAGTVWATVATNLTALINAAKVSGDVIFLNAPPPASSNTGGANYIATYYAGEQVLVNTLSVPLLDIYYRWGSTWGASFMASGTDPVHPNLQGYADIAGALMSFLQRIQ